MVRLRVSDPSGGRNFLLLSGAQFSELRKVNALDGAVAMDRWEMVSTGGPVAEAVPTAHLSAGAFEYFGIPPVLGRYFSESRSGGVSPAETVLVLSYPFWQRRYGGSRDVLGKTLQLDHRNYTIIGVAPPRFRWGNADVYTPLNLSENPDRVYIIDARLKQGVSDREAAAQMQPVVNQFSIQTPEHFPSHPRVEVTRLMRAGGRNIRATLLSLLAAVGVLLAVACANVSILLLARGTVRLHEFAVRSAMGATRGRLLVQLFTESLLLALFGAAAGTLLAAAGTRAVAVSLPMGAFPPETVIRLNFPVLLSTTAIAMVTGVLFGISPALRFSRTSLHYGMRLGDLRATAGAGSRRSHSLLVALQVALTLLLLTGAAAALRGFDDLYHTKLGYNPGNVLTASISLPDGSHPTYAGRAAFYEAIRKQVAAVPGVKSAAISLFAIPPLGPITRSLEIDGQVLEKSQAVLVEEISPEYFSAMGIPLLGGRSWSDGESARAAHVAIVNQAMVRRFWRGVSPIGQRVRLPNFTAFTAWMVAAEGSNDWLEIVGVCGDTPLNGLREPHPPAVYVPYTLVIGDAMNLVIRTNAAPLSMVRALRENVRSIDPGQPVTQVRTATDLLHQEGWAREQFVALVFAAFAGIAIALATIGLFSVSSYAIAVRSREFGIRIAVGAQKHHLAGLVFRSGGASVLSGLTAGLVLSMISDRLLGEWIPWRGADPVWLGALVGLLLIASGIACLVPALRAANSDAVPQLSR